MPNFGAFLAHQESAQIDKTHGFIHPPRKILSFNQQLDKNDGLLVNHIANDKGLVYEDLLSTVLQVSEEWKEKIRKGDTLNLNGLGQFLPTTEGKLQFVPEEKTNYLITSFGFTQVGATPILRETLVKKVSDIEEKTRLTISPPAREKLRFLPLLKYASIFLLLATVGGGIYATLQHQKIKEITAQQKADKILHQKIQEATFFDLAPLEIPTLEIQLEKEITEINQTAYHVIAGAFREQNNAFKKLAQLEARGFAATYLGKNKFGLHQVAYGSFYTHEEALSYLYTIKQQAPDAWLLSVK